MGWVAASLVLAILPYTVWQACFSIGELVGFKYWSANCLLALFLVSPAHADLAPEEILRDAALYTVKVKTLGDIGLNKDEGGSSTGNPQMHLKKKE